VKLTPNVTDIVDVARGAVCGGADAVCAIDTVRSFIGIDIETGFPKLNVKGLSTWGGLSGPSIKPIALGCVSRIAKALSVPIAGAGGIDCWQDAAEFLLLGASNVQVCTAVSRHGFRMVRQMCGGLSGYLRQKGYARLSDMVGGSLKYLVDYSELDCENRQTCSIDETACLRCGTCATACQDAGYGALTFHSGGSPELCADRCRGCGICRSVCPRNCISMK
jgi:dihydropyrimidine dehydrogenase (NAD+) subunit PreA